VPPAKVVHAFIVFHLTLGAVVLIESVRAVLRASGFRAHATPDWHLLVLAGIETVAALLFVCRPTLRAGGAVLLLVFAIAIIAHALKGQFPGALLVYAAGTAFVLAHGPAPRRGAPAWQAE
jgi:hypothetical protein